MSSLTDTFTLSNGVKIPVVGFGTWQTPPGDVCVNSVKSALAAGYRHIDTAAGYNNEESVGQAVRESGIPRDQIFITTKLGNTDHGYDATVKAFNTSIQKLGLDYLDLYLIHWPNPINFRSNWEVTNAESWRALEELYAAKKIRAIGISNFRPKHLDELLKTAKIVPQVNQIRLCPGDTQDETVAYCKERNILLEAYSPLGVGKVLEVKEVQALAAKYGKSVAQICIRWSLQRGYLPLPKSVTAARIEENTKVFDFELAPADVEMLAGLKGCVGYSIDPDTAPF
jgi:diketogulonate reductase-like aldo/keto reductase